jgi:DNA-binding NarL/FixJ family response regulator
MPVMNGFEAALLLKKKIPEMQIVILSQSDTTAFRKEAFAIGATAYITKDKAAEELIPQIRKIMSDKRRNRKHPKIG